MSAFASDRMPNEDCMKTSRKYFDILLGVCKGRRKHCAVVQAI